MAESQGSSKRILAAKFFDKVTEIDQIANTALANSNALQSELSNVQMDLRSLIESLQVNFDSGMQNVQTQINEVTNVVIEEQEIRKSETEALQEQIFAQEDQLQKDVKGNKAKTISADSFSGRMNKRLKKFAKDNAGVLGLLGAGAGLTALSSGGNFFTNFFKKKKKKNNNNKVEEKKEEKITPVITEKKSLIEEVKEEEKKVKEVIVEDKKEEVKEEIKEEIKEEVTSDTSDTSGAEELTVSDFNPSNIQLSVGSGSEVVDNEDYSKLYKPKNAFDPEHYRNTIEELVAKEGEHRRAEITAAIMEQVEMRKRELTTPKDHHPLFKPSGGYKEPPTMEEVNEAYEKGVTLTPGIETYPGEDEVVNVNDKNRGEVRTSSNEVKSANSSVVVINFAELNSEKELSVGGV